MNTHSRLAAAREEPGRMRSISRTVSRQANTRKPNMSRSTAALEGSMSPPSTHSDVIVRNGRNSMIAGITPK